MIGTLSKMRAQANVPVQYHLPVGQEFMDLNACIGKVLTIHHTGLIYCDACGRKTKKSYSQGHCYPCSQKLASCDLCIMRPHTCHYDQGTCREPAWGDAQCMRDHYVYLANSSGLKVGITRGTQVPTRWIDQGAMQALAVLRTRTRQIAGYVEMVVKQHVADTTNWRRLLTGTPEPVDLARAWQTLAQSCAEELSGLQDQFGADAWQLADLPEQTLEYPVTRYPNKVRSFNLDKTPRIESALEGIKGQYLILADGVLNIRKYTGYEVDVSAA